MTTKRVTVYITSLVIDLLGGTEISPGQKIGISPDVVEPWEGALTFAFFPVLVAIAYWADRGAFDSIFAADKVRPSSRCGRVGIYQGYKESSSLHSEWSTPPYGWTSSSWPTIMLT